MYKSEAPVGNGLSARIHQLNGGSGGGNSGLASKRRSQSFLSRSPAAAATGIGTTSASASPSSGLLTGGGGTGTTTHNNNQPFSYINGNNDYHSRHIPSNYYSLDRRPTTATTAAINTSTTPKAPIIYSQVLPKDQRPKKTMANHHHHHNLLNHTSSSSNNTMTTTIGDDRHIHHYVYENPNKENRSKFKSSSSSHLNHDLHSTRPTTTNATSSHQYRSNGNVTKVFINGDGGGGRNNYSGTDEQDDDILTPFSKRFSSMPRPTTTAATQSGYHSFNNGHDLNSSGNTTTTTSTSYYNNNNNSNTTNRYNNDDYMNRGTNFDSSLASSSREASPSPPYYTKTKNQSQQRYETTRQQQQQRSSNLVRDVERQRDYTAATGVPSAKLVRTYLNGNGNVNDDDDEYEISQPLPRNINRKHMTQTPLYQDDEEDDVQYLVQSRARRTNNSNNMTSRINENGGHNTNYKYSYMDDRDDDIDDDDVGVGFVDSGRSYEKRSSNTLMRSSNGNVKSGTNGEVRRYGDSNLVSTRLSSSHHQNSPLLLGNGGQNSRGVLKTSTVRKLNTPASSNGGLTGYRGKSESLLVPERRQTTSTSTLKTTTTTESKVPQAKNPPSSSSGNNFLSTLMRSKKSKSTMNVSKENGNVSSAPRPENGKSPPGTKNRGNILAILLRKATSSKDSKDKVKGKPNANGTHTLKKASSIPKIITDSEIEEVERRRDSGAYYSWSTSDLYGNRNLSNSLDNIDGNLDEDEHGHNDTNTNHEDLQFNVRFTTINEPSYEYPPSSDYYWNKKENGSYQYDDMSDYRRELATTSKPIQSMTNTNSLKKSVTLGRPPKKDSGITNGNNNKSNVTSSTSYYPTSAMSLDRRLLNKKTPKIVVTDDNGEPYVDNSNKIKSTGRSMSFFSLRPKTQNQNNNTVTNNQGPTSSEGNKKWNFGFMNKSKRNNNTTPVSMSKPAGETSFRYFGDTDVEDLPNRNRNVLRTNPEARGRKITYSEDDDASRMSKSTGNGIYLNASNNGSSRNTSPSPYFAKRDGTLGKSNTSKYNTTLLPGTSSATESEVELPTAFSQKSSNGATVFLHAATVAEIPPASPLPLHERSLSRDELSTIHSGAGSQIETHKLSRSVSVLAPWRPTKHRGEGSEINYNSSDGMRSDYSKKPPRPYSLANRSNSSTSISPTDYGKGRNSSGYGGDWKKPRNGSVNSNDSLRLPKHPSHRTASPSSLLLPPPPSGPKRVRQPTPTSTASGQNHNQKSVTLTRSKSMVDSTGERNPRSKNGWSPFRRNRP